MKRAPRRTLEEIYADVICFVKNKPTYRSEISRHAKLRNSHWIQLMKDEILVKSDMHTTRDGRTAQSYTVNPTLLKQVK